MANTLRFCTYGGTLVIPQDRTSQQRATIISHFCYDAPMTDLVNVFPDLLNRAFLTLESILSGKNDENRNHSRRDFGSQLGIHACFYFWNKAFSNDEECERNLDRFFATAPTETRAIVVAEIARIFDGAQVKEGFENEERLLRVQRLWDRRYSQITEILRKNEGVSADFQGELCNFIEWLRCECFPFEWRFTRAIDAINHLQKAPPVFHILELLYKWNEQFPERLNASLHILERLLSKPSDQLRWSVRADKLAPLLSRGLASEDAAIRLHASECRDSLLKLGLFEFLDLEKKPKPIEIRTTAT
jgi:hypothetical protein